MIGWFVVIETYMGDIYLMVMLDQSEEYSRYSVRDS